MTKRQKILERSLEKGVYNKCISYIFIIVIKCVAVIKIHNKVLNYYDTH